jgi:pilus assembly protein CpaE
MTQPLSFVVLSTSLDTFKELRAAMSADERVRLLAGGDDVEQLTTEIFRLRPNAAIITLGANPQSALTLIERIATECPEIAVISAARDASPDLILRSLRAGARDFLRLPIIADEFTTIIDRTAEHTMSQVVAPKKKGRLISVFSSKGGCGTTFIATNLAASMNAPSILVDLNLQAGDLPLFLGVEPKYSIADIVENRARLDDALLTNYITPHSANLALLAAPREADSADEIEPEHVFEALERIRERYEYVVLDPQHTFDSITLAALDQSDDIVLVLTLDIPSIRSAQRSLEIFDRLGYTRRKLKIVVNRFSKQIDLDLRQVQKFLGQEITGFITSDYQTAVNSINLGQPLVQSGPTTKIAMEIRRIASTLVGEGVVLETSQSQRRGVFGSLFRRNDAAAELQINSRLPESFKPSISR